MSEAVDEIGVEEFQARLVRLCTGDRRNLPKRTRDREVLLKAAALAVEGGRLYSEAEINAILRSWLDSVGRTLRTDHVTLRRYLVDFGYLERSPSGDRYFVLERGAPRFAPEVREVDQVQLIAETGRAGLTRGRPCFG